MIRVAEIEDKEALLNIGMGHMEHVGEFTGFGSDETRINAWAEHILTDNDCVCFVYEKDNQIVGLFAGKTVRPGSSTKEFFEEILFVFKPGYTAYSPRLIKAVKKFVVQAELDGLVLGCMSDGGDRLFKLYERMDMKEIERKFVWMPSK